MVTENIIKVENIINYLVRSSSCNTVTFIKGIIFSLFTYFVILSRGNVTFYTHWDRKSLE